jgi:N-methylhydantoinase A/oxoprolinase/acetone carboxylase beta subunit
LRPPHAAAALAAAVRRLLRVDDASRGPVSPRARAATLRIGVDTGGTFTDLVMLRDGELAVHKVPSTPDEPARAILSGIEELLRRPRPRASPGRGRREIVHGSTVATNAVLERRGARVALVTTAGFEDVLAIGRQTRRALYDVFVEAPPPLLAPGMTIGVCERMSAEGRPVEPLTRAELRRVAAAAARSRAEAIAVCLLHSYRNPEHERRLVEALRREGVFVCASHFVLPEYREYERFSTTLLNAYVTPIMARYLTRLERGLGRARLQVMQSSGGTMRASAARARAVQTVLSGPAGGVVAVAEMARAAGHARAIGFDMGGTSTDVCLLDDEIPRTSESIVGDFPLRLPVIDIHTVGAGGGSIAHVDAGGALRVGPRSAGAVPGPACYGTGTEATVTDANLLLGRLDPETFLGGRMRLDTERARAAMRRLAAASGLDGRSLAEGIVRVANANMERALRVVSVERGYDPRDFALVAFGGAGGMHACALAEALEIRTVLVPRHAGVLSALGMLLADVRRDYSRSALVPAAETGLGELRALFAPLVARARAELRSEGFQRSRTRVELALDVRYVGQSYEIPVPFGPGYRREFDRRHARRYGYADPARPAEVVTLRVKAAGLTEKPRLPRLRRGTGRKATPFAKRKARFEGREWTIAFYRREELAAGVAGAGPAVLSGAEATVVIPPGFRFEVDGLGNVVVRRR